MGNQKVLLKRSSGQGDHGQGAAVIPRRHSTQRARAAAPQQQ